MEAMGSTYFSKRLFATKRKPKYGRDRPERQKTFKTEEAARKWAEANKISDYVLVDMKEGKKERKIKVVPKQPQPKAGQAGQKAKKQEIKN
jgi:hypothetical protein